MAAEPRAVQTRNRGAREAWISEHAKTRPLRRLDECWKRVAFKGPLLVVSVCEAMERKGIGGAGSAVDRSKGGLWIDF